MYEKNGKVKENTQKQGNTVGKHSMRSVVGNGGNWKTLPEIGVELEHYWRTMGVQLENNEKRPECGEPMGTTVHERRQTGCETM